MGVGKLVVFEGIDATGKGTQTAMLAERVRAAGKRVETLAFPRYRDSFYGALATRYLQGEFGSVDAVSPYLAALPYAGDRLEAAPGIREALDRNDLVIVDRYVASNTAHQGAKLPFDALAAFAAWVEQLEYGVHGIPREDLCILLDMPVGSALALGRERSEATGDRPDIHERDIAYLAEVAVRYQWLSQNFHHWRLVACVGPDGLLPRESVAETVAGLVAALMGCRL